MKLSKKGIIGLVLLVLLAVGGIVGYSMWNQGHRDIHSEPADFQVSILDLAGEFQKDNAVADKKYHDKVLQFKGQLTAITPGDSLTSISLKGNDFCSVQCEMLPGTQESVSKLKVGDEVTVKAFYMGFMEGEVDFGMPGDILLKKGLIVE